MPVPPSCRVCRAGTPRPWLDFGLQPNSVEFLSAPDQVAGSYPFALHHCPACGFVSVATPLPPDLFYEEHQQGTSAFPAAHLPWLVKRIFELATDFPSARLFEIGCNDGHLLKLLREAGLTELRGIDPSERCSAQARLAHLPVETGYFNQGYAQALRAQGYQADLLLCRHVLEHIPDLDDFVGGMATLLAEPGQLLIEVPDFAAATLMGDFSTLWDQHLNYFTASTLGRIFGRHGFQVLEIHSLPHGGGSLLVRLQRGIPTPCETHTVDGAVLAKPFLDRIEAIQSGLHQLKDEGRRIAAFGAGMRGTMLINLARIGTTLDYVVDDDPAKLGRFLPGSRLPILPTDHLEIDPPDCCLLLPLNSKSAEQGIMQRFRRFQEGGGRFIEVFPPSGDALSLRH